MSIDILVIEDTEHHLNDVKKFMDARQREGSDVVPRYVRTLDEAKSNIYGIKGIISDVFFPREEGLEATCQADEMMTLSKIYKIPLIFCTDGDHHGPHLNHVPHLGDGPLYLGMVDMAIDRRDRLHEIIRAPIKNWPRAYMDLMLRINKKEYERFKAKVDSSIYGYWGPEEEVLRKYLE